MKYHVDHVDIDEISRFPAQKSEDFIQNSSKKVVENGSFRENCELWTVGSLRNRREILQVNRGICRSRRDLAVLLAESLEFGRKIEKKSSQKLQKKIL